MHLPRRGSHYSARVDFGTYLGSRLRRAKRSFADDIRGVTDAVQKAGEERDHARRPIQEALADRDAVDDDLDGTAQQVRLSVASRSVDAVKKAPYTQLFPDGIGYYIAAPLDQEVRRYNELKSRLVELLPAEDSVRSSAIAAIDKGVAAFTAAAAAVEKARTEESLASMRLDAAEESFDRQIERIYGALVSELGRVAAERFFPRMSARRDKKDDGETQG